MDDIARRYGEEIVMEDKDPRELSEQVRVAPDADVPEEIEERLKRERDEDEGEAIEG